MDNSSAGQNVANSGISNTSVTCAESLGQGHLSNVYRTALIRTNSGGSLPEPVRHPSVINGSFQLLPQTPGHSSAPVSTVNAGSLCSSNTGTLDFSVGKNSDYA